MTAKKPHEHQPGCKAAIEAARKIACKTAVAAKGRLMLGLQSAEVKFKGVVAGPKITRKLQLYQKTTQAKNQLSLAQRQFLRSTGRSSDAPVPTVFSG